VPVIIFAEVEAMITILAILVVLAFVVGIAVLGVIFCNGEAGKTGTIIDDIEKR